MSKCLCDDCLIEDEARKSPNPSCCIWYMDNVVLGTKTVKECTDFTPKNKENTNDQI